jgi:response regulator RpfG family c-di-GMP phosphodiesterase
MSDKPKVLVVDDEVDLVDIIQLGIEMEFDAQVLTAHSGRAATEVMKAHPDIVAIISDVNMPDGDGLHVYNEAKQLLPSAKFFFCSGNPPATIEARLGADAASVKIFSKPEFMSPIRDSLAEILSGDKKPESSVFCPVSLNLLLKIGLVPYDLFLRLGEQKYVKVSLSGEQFTQEDASPYIAKKVSHLYLPKQHAGMLASDLVRMLSILAEKPASVEQTVAMQTDAVEAIHDMVETFGLTPETSEMIAASVQCTQKFLQKHADAFPALLALQQAAGGYFAKRSVMLSYLAGAIAKMMKWDSDLTYLKLSYAAALCDISLSTEEVGRLKQFEAMALAVNFAEVMDSDLKKFMEHPRRSADILAKMKDIPIETDVLVLQHHELPDGTGYPGRLHHSRIGTLSAVVIFGWDLVNHLLAQEKIEDQTAAIRDFCKAKTERYSHGTFRKIHQQVSQVVASGNA